MADISEPQWKANPHWKTTKEDGVRSDVWLFVKRLNIDHPMNNEKNGNFTHICLLSFIKSGKNGQKRNGGTSFQRTQAKRHLEGGHPDFVSSLSKKLSEIPGALEHGVFLDTVHLSLIGHEGEVKVYKST